MDAYIQAHLHTQPNCLSLNIWVSQSRALFPSILPHKTNPFYSSCSNTTLTISPTCLSPVRARLATAITVCWSLILWCLCSYQYNLPLILKSARLAQASFLSIKLFVFEITAEVQSKWHNVTSAGSGDGSPETSCSSALRRSTLGRLPVFKAGFQDWKAKLLPSWKLWSPCLSTLKLFAHSPGFRKGERGGRLCGSATLTLRQPNPLLGFGDLPFTFWGPNPRLTSFL